jgi:mRNA-degrading endonuclease RelE of RelBE toxin-antitoxin system
MSYGIELENDSANELRALRVFERRRIVDEMSRNLRDEPTVRARNRKPLLGLIPSFFHVPPIWELRVGEFRVFYDVDEAEQVVRVRAVRRKTPEQPTEDVT